MTGDGPYPGKFTVTRSGSMLMIVGVWEDAEHRHELIMQVRQGGEFRLHDVKSKKEGDDDVTDETHR